MVAKKILDEANKNKAVQDAANKTKEELERHNLSQVMHWQNRQQFMKDQINESKQRASYDQAKQENDPEWSKIIQTAQKWFHGEQAGYETFVSASSAQVNFICELAPVAAKKINVVLGGLPYTYVGEQLKNLIKNPTSCDPTKYQVPSLEFEIGMNSNNALEITKLEFKGPETELLPGQQVTREQIEAFQTGVVVWLMKEGYTPSATDAGKFIDKNGVELNNEKLTNLNPQINLTNYFEKLREEVNLTARKIAEDERNSTNSVKQTSQDAWEKTAKEEKAKKRQEAADKKAEAEADEEAQPSTAPRPK